MSEIEHVVGREVLDSRGNPTVEVEVVLATGARGRAIVPSGASTGEHEAVELRDGGERFGGKGVETAVGNVNGEIRDALLDFEALDQRGIDTTLIDLDGTPNKARLGANAILGVSLAVAKAAADELALPLYRYVGGSQRAHASRADDERPQRRRARRQQRGLPRVHGDADRRRVVSRGVALGRRDLPRAQEPVARAGLSTLVGDEGGFAPDLAANEDAVRLLVEAIERAGYTPGTDIAIALDPATSELYRDGRYELKGEGRTLQPGELADLWVGWLDRYPIVSIEDGMAEDDWDGWRALTDAAGNRVQLVGDDLFVTNTERLEMGIDAVWRTRCSSR